MITCMLQEHNWEYLGTYMGWLYFRKPASLLTRENDGEIFFDNSFRTDMLQYIMNTRMLPMRVIFLCCFLPNISRTLAKGISNKYAVFWLVLHVVFCYSIIHYVIKLRILKKISKIKRMTEHSRGKAPSQAGSQPGTYQRFAFNLESWKQKNRPRDSRVKCTSILLTQLPIKTVII